jgi:hypothetical protein
MKCRKWGHFANACTADMDTCGTCGGMYRTKDCSSKEKIHCVSCNSNTHASWDCNCLEFTRHCRQYNENYPENSLTYFPTHEDWTLTLQPSKIPYEEKFPSRYSVSMLPPPRQNTHNPAPKGTGMGRQHRQRPIRLPQGQSTIDKFVTSGVSQHMLDANEDHGPSMGVACKGWRTWIQLPPIMIATSDRNHNPKAGINDGHTLKQSQQTPPSSQLNPINSINPLNMATKRQQIQYLSTQPHLKFKTSKKWHRPSGTTGTSYQQFWDDNSVKRLDTNLPYYTCFRPP